MSEEDLVPYRGFRIRLLFGHDAGSFLNDWSAYDQDGVQLCKNMYDREICLEAAQRLIDGRVEFYLARAGVQEYVAKLEAENKQLREIIAMQNDSRKEISEILEGLLKKIEGLAEKIEAEFSRRG